ncbi:PAS domain-containing protein [Rhizobium glycinendophyticum]|uniref:histidine kinase n=1 Tax=Rhizobium glycinendophyticum TaxID=2589807 RepID=A0A504TU79_9HYPH|nr:PAS domain-containing protein [Rhizobium glycinendophyticum]TPP05954.1 histidine kinase [Rhizobium glycinendophyticum]
MNASPLEVLSEIASESVIERQIDGSDRGDEGGQSREAVVIQYLKLAEDRGTVGFWSCDSTGVTCCPSAGLLRLLGLEAGAHFRIAEIADFAHPEDRAQAENIWLMIRSGVPVERRFRIVRADRTVRWIDFRSEVVLDDAQQPSRSIGIVIDVTAQHESRETIEDTLGRYRALVNSLATMEWRATADGSPIYSHGWTALTGQLEVHVARGNWIDAVHPDDRQRVATAWNQSVRTLTPYMVNHRLRCVTGEYQWFHARAVPIIKKGGRSHEWLGIIMLHDDLNTRGGRDTDDGYDLTPMQIRAGRAMLQWTLGDLSDLSGISVSSIRRIEAEGERATRPASMSAIRKAFEDHGLCFSGGNAVSFRRADPSGNS